MESKGEPDAICSTPAGVAEDNTNSPLPLEVDDDVRCYHTHVALAVVNPLTRKAIYSMKATMRMSCINHTSQFFSCGASLLTGLQVEILSLCNF